MDFSWIRASQSPFQDGVPCSAFYAYIDNTGKCAQTIALQRYHSQASRLQCLHGNDGNRKDCVACIYCLDNRLLVGLCIYRDACEEKKSSVLVV